jgi:type IV pilus assembly protein PilQ
MVLAFFGTAYAQQTTTSTTGAGAGATTINSIESMVVAQQASMTTVKIDLKQALDKAPSYFSVTNPARMVLDLPNTTNNLGRTLQEVNGGQLRSINIVQVGNRTRLVLNLKKAGNYQTRQEGKSLLITLSGNVVDGASEISAQHFAALSTTQQTAESRSVRDLKFRRGKGGEGLVTLDLSDPNTAIDVRPQGDTLIIDLQRTQISNQIHQRMDVTDFATPVTSVTTARQGNNARITIAAHGLWEHTAYQSDSQFVIEVRPLKEDPSKLFQGSQRQSYQGEKVSLNFQNIPLRELLHVFADITNFNIVVSDSVSGNVSLRLNDVPWDQALEIVLKQKGLAMRKNGNVLWIAPADELAAREKMEMDARQAMTDYEPLRTEAFQLNYQKANDVLTTLYGGLPRGVVLPAGLKSKPVLSERGSVVADQRTNKLFVTDTPSKLNEIRALISAIDISVRQVLIEARIVEADDSFSKSLGVRVGVGDQRGLDTGHKIAGSDNWSYGIAGSQEYVNYHIQSPTPLMTWQNNGQLTYDTSATTANGNGTTSMMGNVSGGSNLVNLGIPNAAGQIALALFNSSKTQLLSLELSALESDGKGKTISSPRILTADQVKASIEDGQEIPYWSASSSGATTVEFRKAVLSLNVTPQITPDGKVLMHLEVNKDSPNPSYSTNYGIAIDTKNVKTDVLVDNGGTVVIGGIYINKESNTVTKVPLLGDIPILGALFRQRDRTTSRSELLVFITPKIINDALSLR